jgi:subtilisin-like proprotein convertase family protein
LSWTAASPAPGSGYDIYYSTSATAPIAGTAATTTTAAAVVTKSITGLTANTTYYWWVRSNCNGTDKSSWVSGGTFFTGYCQPTNTTSGDYISSFSTSGGTLNINNSGTGTAALEDFTAQTVSQFATGSVSFSGAYAGGSAGFSIWVDWNNNLVFDASERMFNASATAASWTGSFIVPTGQALGNYRMRIRAQYNTLSPPACGVVGYGQAEDYTFTVVAAPACAQTPSALTSSVTSATTATLSWTAASPAPGSGYEIYYSTSSSAPVTGTTATTTTGAGVVTKNITGLTANTTYYWWVRSNCNGTDKSNWVSGGTFTTLCDAISTFPWTETFDASSTSQSCWKVTDGNADGDLWNMNGTLIPRSGESAQLNTDFNASNQDYLITPQINLGTSAKQIKFWVRHYDNLEPDNLNIKLSTSGNTIASFTNNLLTLSTTQITTTYTEYTVSLASYTGNVFIAFARENAPADGWYISIDDVTIELAPACPGLPSNLISSAVATTTATLSWTAASPAPGSGYEIYYSTSSSAPIAGTAATTTTAAGVVTKNITGLTANTTYYWWVRSNCNGTDKGSWVSGGTFYPCTGSCNSVCPSIVSSLPVTNQALSCTSVALPGSFSSSNISTCGSTSSLYLGGQEALYMFTPGSTGEITISYSGQTWSAIWLFQGCPTSGGTCVGSVGSSASTQSLTANVTSGIPYYLIFDTYPSPNSPCAGTFSITAPVGPPTNDLCANATTLTVYANGACSSTSGTTSGASQEVASNPTCDPTGTIKDVWYKFNSGSNGTLNFGVTLGTAANVGIEFFSACGTLATGLSSSCDFQASNPNPTVISGFALNTEYYFRLFTNTSYDAAGTFTVCVYQNPAPTCASVTSPTNGATGQTLTLNLQWAATTNAEGYDVYLSDNQTLVNNQNASVKVSSDQTTTTYAASGLNGLTTYYWRVVPKNGAGAPSGCTTWSFTTSQPEYATAWISANTGDTWWCQGETRTVTVTVKNNGSQSWIDGGGVDFNVGIKWNNDPDYPGNLRVDAQNLAAGATGTFTFTVTAPTAGNNNLTFDVVREGCFWFGTNSGAYVNGSGVSCPASGPGNVTYSKVANVNNTYPTANAGSDVNACVGSSVNLSGSSPNISGTFTSTNNTSGNISDGVNLDRTIVVSGTNVNANQLTSLTLNLTHTYTGDLDITLFAPNGSSIDLSSDNGAGGYNYTNTVFSTSGTAITAGTAPFTGTFTPEMPFSSLTGSADGTWTLRIYDDGSGDAGTFTNWSINIPTSNAPTVAWSGPNSFSSSSLTTSVSNIAGSASNYTLTSTFRGCTTTDIVQVTGTGPTTLATTPTAGSAVWRGVSSTDWTTASNWYEYDGTNYTVATATPTASSSVIIPANQGCVTQQPAVAISGTVNANNLTVETGAALTMGTSSVLNVAGNFTVNGTGTFTPGTGTVNFTGNGTQVVTNGTQAFNNVTISGFGTVQLTGNTTINGNFLNNAGTLNMGNHNLTIGGNYANYSGLQIGSGSVIFNKDSGTQTVEQLAVDFGNIQHTGGGTLELASDISMTGNLTNSAGILSAQSYGITLKGDWTNSGTGVFNPGTGFVAFAKENGAQSINNGTSTFYNMKHLGGATLTFAAVPEVKENVEVNGPIAATTHFKLTGTNNQTISGSVTEIAIQDMTVNKTAGTVTLSKPLKVSGALTMTAGDIITTPTNILEVGSSVSSVGSITWTSGTVRGPMKRWFSGSSNSTQESGIFPVGVQSGAKAGTNRYAQVNFTSNPGTGGYIIAQYVNGTPEQAPTGLPLNYSSGSYPQAIQNYEEEGYWDITPYSSSNLAYAALNSASYTLKLRLQNPSTLTTGWTPSNDGNDLYNASTIRMIRAKGSNNHANWELAGTHSSAVETGNGDYYITSTGITEFSWFNGGGNNQNPLPVELVSFTGACDNGVINLTWQTASEFNSSHFDVEKSRDGENWQVLTTLPSAGTSNELITYQSTDQNGTEGNNYFRLRQVDVDGTEKLYDPINVSCSEVTTGYFSSFPNPSGSSFQVIVNNKELLGVCTMNIVDASGKVIDQREIEVKDGINMYVINQELTPGMYFLNISNGSKSTPVLRHAIK